MGEHLRDAVGWILESLDADGLKKLCERAGLPYGRTNVDRRERLAVAFNDPAALIRQLRVPDLRDALREVDFETAAGTMTLTGASGANRDELVGVAHRVFVDRWTPSQEGDAPVRGSSISTSRVYWDEEDEADAPEETDGVRAAREVLEGRRPWSGSDPARGREHPQDVHDDESVTTTYPEIERLDPWRSSGPEGRHDAELADFQRAAVESIVRHFRRPGARGLLCLPTGGGKTRTSLEWLLRNVVGAGQRILWMTHRIDLLDQVHEEIRGLAWLLRDVRPSFTISRVQAQHKNLSGDIVLASTDSLRNLAPTHAALSRDGIRLGVVCYDEAHRAVAKETWRTIDRVIKSQQVPLLGLTATPFRTESGGTSRLRQLLGDVVYQRTFKELIEVGFLARPIFIRQLLHSTEGFRLSTNEAEKCRSQQDLTPSVLGRLARHPHRNEEIVKHWAAHRDTYGKTLAFACDIGHAEALADVFRRAGARSEALHSGLETVARQRMLDRFRDGATDVLVNVGILTEGANIPDTRTVLLARPTMSTSLYLQMIGRGARGPRTVPGKHHFHVIDCVDNFQRHGLVMAGREVAAELDAEMREQPTAEPTRAPRPTEKDAQRQRRAASVSTAWLRVRGFDPSQYSFWGELRWTTREGDERSVAVFVEGIALLEQALGLLRSALQTGRWDSVRAQARVLDEVGAFRAVDWEAVARDCALTARAPELFHVPELRIEPADDLVATRLIELAALIQQQGVPAGLAACETDWNARADMKARFASVADLRHEVILLVAAQKPQAPAAPPVAAANPWEPVEAFISLGMAVAASDGTIDPAEMNAITRAVERTFQLQDSRQRTHVESLIGAARANRPDLLTAARRLRGALTSWQAQLVAFDWLFRVALADGRLEPVEIAALREVSPVLEIPEEELQERIAWYRDVDSKNPVSTLTGFRTCGVCNTTWPGDSRFCGACGTSLRTS